MTVKINSISRIIEINNTTKSNLGQTYRSSTTIYELEEREKKLKKTN